MRVPHPLRSSAGMLPIFFSSVVCISSSLVIAKREKSLPSDDLDEVIALGTALAEGVEEERWFGSWVTNNSILEDMITKMRTPGSIVKLSDVLEPKLAEELWLELNQQDVWDHSLDINFVGVPPPLRQINSTVCPRLHKWMDLHHPLRFQFAHHNTYTWMTDNPSADSPALYRFNDYLSSLRVRRFLSAIAATPLLTLPDQSMTGSWYRPPFDHSTVHCDSSRDRRVTFIVHLAKEWRPEYGGQFVCEFHSGSAPFLPRQKNANLFYFSDVNVL